tara:strand:- start:10798 stop:11658 length:861 start_codon:yes stop_codon:yes gene_type:complete
MNINYLILAHSNYSHLTRLIHALDDVNVQFYIHIDKKAEFVYETDKSNVYILEKRSSIYWGGFGMIEATLALLKKAKSCGNGGYYILLSGADFPIRSNETIRNVLSSKKEFINIQPGPLYHKPIERYQHYYFDIDRRNPKGIRYLLFRFLEKLQIRLKIKRKIPFNLYVGSQWFALTHECIEYILDEVNNNVNYLRFFKNVFIPDEAFFHTIIGNSPFLERTEGNLTYVDWSVHPGPANINENHLQKFQENEFFETKYGKNKPMFARKFDDNSEDIIKSITSTIRL